MNLSSFLSFAGVATAGLAQSMYNITFNTYFWLFVAAEKCTCGDIRGTYCASRASNGEFLHGSCVTSGLYYCSAPRATAQIQFICYECEETEFAGRDVCRLWIPRQTDHLKQVAPITALKELFIRHGYLLLLLLWTVRGETFHPWSVAASRRRRPIQRRPGAFLSIDLGFLIS